MKSKLLFFTMISSCLLAMERAEIEQSKNKGVLQSIDIKKDLLSELPNDLKLHIAQQIPIHTESIVKSVVELYKLSQINREWRAVCSEPIFWKFLFYKFFKNLLLRETCLNLTKDHNIFLFVRNVNKAMNKFIADSKSNSILNSSILNAIESSFKAIACQVELNLNLHLAISSKDINSFKTLLETAETEGMLKSQSFKLWDMLLISTAGEKNLFEIVKILTEKNADINSCKPGFDHLLISAVAAGSKEIAELCLRKPNTDQKFSHEQYVEIKNRYKTTPLMAAAARGKTEMVKYFLNLNANVHAQDINGDTSLHWAVRNKHIEIVELLLSHQANINIQNTEGITPLVEAVYNNDEYMVTFLLDNGANVNLKTKQNLTALVIALQYRSASFILKKNYDNLIKILENYSKKS